LAISFAFVDKFLAAGRASAPILLFFAWLCWVFSLALVLVSYYFSHLALRRAIRQVDEGHDKDLGGPFNTITKICNAAGGLAFITGLVIIAVFVLKNLGAKS
jgi:hypothetical protein